MTEAAAKPAASDAERVRLIDRAVKTWTGELVDLGGRNTRRYYRDLKQDTLDVGPTVPAASQRHRNHNRRPTIG